MTLYELREKYYFHDSNIEKVDFDADKKILTLEIEFCFWWQPWHEKNKPSNGLIRLTFEEVSLFEYDDDIADRIFSDELDSEILKGELDEEGNLVFFSVETPDFSNDDEDIYWQLKINAANVEVEELERYNL